MQGMRVTARDVARRSSASPRRRVSARKVVSVLFSDVCGFTELGEHLEPESLHELIGRWFYEAHQVIVRHGGTVEKYMGDAVMAVFGVPVVHEDDALRAARAALGMRTTLTDLNQELVQRWGVQLDVRTGVNTGEVVVGETPGGERPRSATRSTSPSGSRPPPRLVRC